MIREQNHHSLKRENCSGRNSPPESTLFLRTQVQVLKQNSSESHWTCLTCNNSFFITIIIIFSRTSLMQTIVFFTITIFFLQYVGNPLAFVLTLCISTKYQFFGEHLRYFSLGHLKATPEMSFADFGRTYFNLDFSAFHISALA